MTSIATAIFAFGMSISYLVTQKISYSGGTGLKKLIGVVVGILLGVAAVTGMLLTFAALFGGELADASHMAKTLAQCVFAPVIGAIAGVVVRPGTTMPWGYIGLGVSALVVVGVLVTLILSPPSLDRSTGSEILSKGDQSVPPSSAPNPAERIDYIALLDDDRVKQPGTGDSAKNLIPKVYRTECAMCHDSGVAGAPRPGSPAMQRISSEEYRATISRLRAGVGAMPPVDPALTDAQLAGALRYLALGS